MDLCGATHGLCGYRFFNGSNLRDPGKNGGNSIVSGTFVGGCSRNDHFDCHGCAVLGIELQSKSLGNHRYWSIYDFTNCKRRARSVLCAVCISGSCLHITHYLVYLEVETSSGSCLSKD